MILETVFPPKSFIKPGNSSILDKYNIAFLGGVPTRASTRASFYLTDIEPLQGCLRGFVVGDHKYDLFNDGIVTKGAKRRQLAISKHGQGVSYPTCTEKCHFRCQA